MIPSLLACAVAAASAIALGGCGGSSSPATAAPVQSITTRTTPLPGVGRPTVTIGDKNYTEQFILGELYYQALKAEGFSVQLNKNIGATEVTMQALQTGQLGMYPEYIDTWNSAVAGYQRNFTTLRGALRAGQRYARTHGLELLEPTPFSDTDAIAVTVAYASENHLRTIADLESVASSLTLGGPPQFQSEPDGLPGIEQAYGFQPAAFKSLEIGQQYQALDQDVVQAADVSTTDGELTTGDYDLLADPLRVFGVGNVVPVVTSRVLAEEGPAFAATINRVSSLLTLSAIREMNAEVDIAGEDPGAVAQQFLVDHGVVPATGS